MKTELLGQRPQSQASRRCGILLFVVMLLSQTGFAGKPHLRAGSGTAFDHAGFEESQRQHGLRMEGQLLSREIRTLGAGEIQARVDRASASLVALSRAAHAPHADQLPDGILAYAALDPADSPDVTAQKLVRLALVVRDMYEDTDFNRSLGINERTIRLSESDRRLIVASILHKAVVLRRTVENDSPDWIFTTAEIAFWAAQSYYRASNTSYALAVANLSERLLNAVEQQVRGNLSLLQEFGTYKTVRELGASEVQAEQAVILKGQEFRQDLERFKAGLAAEIPS